MQNTFTLTFYRYFAFQRFSLRSFRFSVLSNVSVRTQYFMKTVKVPYSVHKEAYQITATLYMPVLSYGTAFVCKDLCQYNNFR